MRLTNKNLAKKKKKKGKKPNNKKDGLKPFQSIFLCTYVKYVCIYEHMTHTKQWGQQPFRTKAKNNIGASTLP